jgi:hypothetical protein
MSAAGTSASLWIGGTTLKLDPFAMLELTRSASASDRMPAWQWALDRAGHAGDEGGLGVVALPAQPWQRLDPEASPEVR